MRLSKEGTGGIKKCDICGTETFYKKPRRWDICSCCEKKDGVKNGRRKPPVQVRRLFLEKKCEACGDSFEIRSKYYDHQRFCSVKCSGVVLIGKAPSNKIWDDKSTRTKNYYLKYREIPEKRIASNIRTRLRSAILAHLKSERHYKKIGKLEPVIGCTVAELVIHIESKFEPWMSWGNYGHLTWHIDHIKPISKFDLKDPVQFAQANHYTNLRPLSAHENFVKHNSYNPVNEVRC